MLELSRDSDITLKIRVSYTRALLPDDERHLAQNLHKDALPEGLSLTAGRVHMRRVLSEFADHTSSSLTASGIKGHGIALAVCGPASLGKDVASAMATLGAEDRNAVGGVEFYEECVSNSSLLCLLANDPRNLSTGRSTGSDLSFHDQARRRSPR